MKLYNECDYLDVIFMELPFSMSQGHPSGIRNLLSQLDNVPPESIDPNCPLMGNQVYQKAGETLAEADFYISEGCNYFVFTYQGKKYYNKVKQTGINFYENLRNKKFNQ